MKGRLLSGRMVASMSRLELFASGASGERINPFIVDDFFESGCPPQGGRKRQLVKMDQSLTSAIDGWIAQHEQPMTRSEAIRRLVEMGLKGKTR